MRTVWSDTLDGRYACKVETPEDSLYAGRLSITDAVEDKVIYEQAVGVSFGAVVGPDMADVGEWQELCIRKIDEGPAA